MTAEEKAEYDKGYRSRNKERIASYQKEYKQDTKETPRNRYRQQKENSRRRGIPWDFTLGYWLLWWGIDYLKRGVNSGQLVMCRYGDEGPYSFDNCYKGTPAMNVQDNWDNRRGED